MSISRHLPPDIDIADRAEFDIDGLDEAELDSLPFGAIKVDADGRIHFYNMAESRLSGRLPDRVIGRSFFHDVAPCTNMPGFYGRFVESVVAERSHVTFTFVFDFAMRPVRVRIDMRPAREAGRYWILVRPFEYINREEETEAEKIVKAAQVRVVGETIDATICDREPLHVPDAIQPHGALIVIDAEKRVVTAASRNLDDYIGVPLERALGRSAEELLEPRFLDAILAATSGEGVKERGSARFVGGRWLSFTAHQSPPSLIIELQFQATTPLYDGYRVDVAPGFLNAFFNAVISAPPSDYIAQEAARKIREFSGFDRVLIYQFDEAGNGSVVAEEKVTEWEQTLVGLNFPASDIPKQARALYMKSRIRHSPNNAYIPCDLVRAPTHGLSTPIDLSLASLRSVSPVHRAYLNNMGVVSSFSASILVNGALWGMLIGHHRTPRHLSWERLDAIERAAEVLGPRLAQTESHDAQVARRRHEETHRAFLEQLAKSEDLLDSFARDEISLTNLFVHCTGAAAKIGGRLVLVGHCPSRETVERLIHWLQDTVAEDVWATDCISGFMPEMIEERVAVSGVLVGFLTPSHEDLVLWFRPESEEVVVWAGDPNEKRVVEGAPLPRKRFEHWIELKSAHSRPWGAWKHELTSRLSHAMTAVLSAQFVKLKILNEKLELASSVKDRFLAQMSHELRTPLNAVIGFSELIASGFAGPTTPKQSEYLADILTAGNHLLSLINDILEISRLEAGKYVVAPISLDAASLALGVVEMLGPQAGQQGVTLHCSINQALPLVTDERSLTQILVNLLSNAVKFTPSGGLVSLAAANEAETVVFTVTDNGVGMDATTLGEIGKPFFQAQSAYMAPPGTGLGLSIVRALVKENGGTLTFDSRLGVGTTVVLCLPRNPASPAALTNTEG